MRNPTKDKAKDDKAKAPAGESSESVPVVEREINLGLINDKLNYVISTVNKIAEACDVELNQ